MNKTENKKIKITFSLLEKDFIKLKALAYFYNERPSKLAFLLLEEAIEGKMQNLNSRDKKDFSRLLEITYENHSKKKD